MIYVTVSGERLCEDGWWDHRHDDPCDYDYAGYLQHTEEGDGPCDCHPDDEAEGRELESQGVTPAAVSSRAPRLAG